MAVIRLGSVVSDIRGSIGTETYSRNQGGLFVRERVTPTDPGSAAQVLARAAVTACSQYWSGTLTQSQRDDWDTYAGQYPIPDQWGHPKYTSGYVWFLRTNIGWYRTVEAVGFPGPPAGPPLALHAFALAVTWADVPDELTFVATLAGTPAAYNGLAMHMSTGLPMPPGVSYYATPYITRLLDTYNGAWASSLTVVVTDAVDQTGKRVWARLRAQDATTGQVSGWSVASAIVGV